MLIGTINSELIKILFDTVKENLFLGDIIKVINKEQIGILAQVVKIDSSKDKPSCNVASCKILFTTLPDNKLINWRGNVPSKDNSVSILSSKEILDYVVLNSTNNISLGQFTLHEDARFNFNADSLKNPTLIFCEKQEQRINISQLISQKIAEKDKRVILLDLRGEYTDIDNAIRLIAGIDFKLPLNSKGIDILYERTLLNASAETRAVIEDIFMNVQEYADESEQGFIPFSSFKYVVENEYNRSRIPELVLLKNKLIKLDKEGIFADTEDEISILSSHLNNDNLIILDLSHIPSLWHKEFIDSIITTNIEKYEQSFFFVLEMTDKNFNDDLLNKIYVSGLKSGISPVVLTGYNSSYVGNVMTVAKNLIFFSPKVQTDKFPEFNSFINRLDSSEALITGQITRDIPLFVQIDQMGFAVETEIQENIEPVNIETVENPQPDYLEEKSSDDVLIPASNQPVYFDSEDEFYEHYEEQSFDDQSEEEIEAYDEVEDIESQDSEELTQDQFDAVDALYTNQKAESEPEVSTQEMLEDLENDIRENDVSIMPTPDIPVYAAEEPEEKEFDLQEGDTVKHQKYGEGVIKKIIGYGNKKLCSIEFTNVGRRLLDPSLAVIEKV